MLTNKDNTLAQTRKFTVNTAIIFGGLMKTYLLVMMECKICMYTQHHLLLMTNIYVVFTR